MDAVTKQIRIDYHGKEFSNQFYMDEDINVPDSQIDIARVIYSNGKASVEDIKHENNRLTIIGKLHYQILYMTEEEESRPASLEGRIPFEEVLYIEEEEEGHFLMHQLRTEFTATMIHPRKLSLKAMVEMKVAPEGVRKEEIICDLEGASALYKKCMERTLLSVHTQKKDTYRIKEEITVPGTAEDVGHILWSDVSLRKMDSRLKDGVLEINGELQVFCFYQSSNGKAEWTEQTVSFQGRVDCPEVKEIMYHHLEYQISDPLLEARPDSDGEMRILGVEGTLELLITVYVEETIPFLEDVYSLKENCSIQREHRVYEELCIQNHSKCKLTEQLTLPELKGDILQICHSDGEVQVLNMEPGSQGLSLEGLVHLHFLYVKSDDQAPYDTWEGMVPFSYLMECGQLTDNTHHELSAGLEQLTISLLGGNQVEVRAVLYFDAFFRNHVPVEVITDVQTEPYKIEDMEKGAGIIGYIVRPGDDLWALAKKYRTTKESIMQTNQLEEEKLISGQKILILKENTVIL